MGDVECKACAAGLPIVWDVQQQRNMHLAPGLCTFSCARLDARAERERVTTNDRGIEDQRAR